MRADGRRIFVAAVLAGGPAEEQGLQAGDELLALDGLRLPDEHALEARLRCRRPGDRVRLAVFRRDQLEEVELVLGERPEEKFEIVPRAGATPDALALREAWLGGSGARYRPSSSR